MQKVDDKKAKDILLSRWEEISGKKPENFVEDINISGAIERSINSNTKSFRHAMLTQILAKATNPSIDCRCLQKKRGGPGAFDARSFSRKVIVDFDRGNESVLSGSGDPYVSKPLRHEEISERYRSEIRNKKGWDDLCFLLNKVEEENNPEFTSKVLDQILLEIKQRLETIKVIYPTPIRISIDKSHTLVMEYLSEPSEGARLEVIAYSLFKTLGEIYGQYDEISQSKPTAPNHFMGKIADIECYLNGKLVKGVELKDRELTKHNVEESISKISKSEVTEFSFVMTKGVNENDRKDIEGLIKREYEKGRNIYIEDIEVLSRTMLILFGEEGRKKFLNNTNNALEELTYPYEHRRKWAELLDNL